MRQEIGSHFEFDYNIVETDKGKVDWLPFVGDSTFTFSGRSAIELAILDIKLERKVKRVYMPSYCCKSMVDPFIKNEIEVMFYEVYFDVESGIQYHIDLNVECDIFFAMSYFGIEKFQHDLSLNHFKEKGTIILEDITHRLLSKTSYSPYADYIIASFRKWFPIPTGGFIAKLNNRLNISPSENSDDLVIEKVKAMKSKAAYLLGEDEDKQTYLHEMAAFEKEFKERDFQYQMDSISLSILQNIDIESITKQRQDNARILYEGIISLQHIKPLIYHPDFDTHSPLFLPIMIEEDKRDSLRSYLIERSIYCPIHWPNTEVNSSNISNNELSLICDQRYSKEDMVYIIDLIQQWYHKKY